MDVSDVLKKAWAAVEEADLPSDIHEAAFREAVRMLLPVAPASAAQPRGATVSGPSSGSGSVALKADGENRINVTEDEIYDRVAAQTDARREVLEQIVHLDGDALRVSIPGLRLGRNNAERARTVAQILTIARGFGLEESDTSLELIRDECDRLRVYDQANFSAHMKALSGYIVTGTGSNRRLRAKGPGIQAFPALIEHLVGE
jgi:hypothetical protein